jgi:hypothetical protein
VSYQAILNSPITRGALTGVVAAAYIDFQAFRAWKSWHDVATYQWSTATWRWFQGAMIGAVAAGLGL